MPTLFYLKGDVAYTREEGCIHRMFCITPEGDDVLVAVTGFKTWVDIKVGGGGGGPRPPIHHISFTDTPIHQTSLTDTHTIYQTSLTDTHNISDST